MSLSPSLSLAIDQTIELPLYGGREGRGVFRSMTPDEARRLGRGDHAYFRAVQGDARRVKINGKVRTWKRTPHRLAIPVKYGMYEYATVTETDLAAGQLLVKVA